MSDPIRPATPDPDPTRLATPDPDPTRPAAPDPDPIRPTVSRPDPTRPATPAPGALPVRPRPGKPHVIVAALIAAFGVVMFAVAVNSGRADSALLFVGLPVALAVTLALLPARTGHGRVFTCTTIGLLLAAVALREGAICVILAAPLVYLIAHTVTWLVRLARRGVALVVLPLVLLAGLEGSVDGLRVQPVQSVTVTRVVPLSVSEVEQRIEAGPAPTGVRPLPLRVLEVPVPAHVTGAGLEPGDQWRFGYHGSSHGPGGEIVTRVTDRGPGRVTFDVPSDTAITARWFRWEQATLSWRAVDERHTEVRVEVSFTRGLDPSWYFGPLQQYLMRAGMAHLLDMLGLSGPAR